MQSPVIPQKSGLTIIIALRGCDEGIRNISRIIPGYQNPILLYIADELQNMMKADVMYEESFLFIQESLNGYQNRIVPYNLVYKNYKVFIVNIVE